MQVFATDVACEISELFKKDALKNNWGHLILCCFIVWLLLLNLIKKLIKLDKKNTATSKKIDDDVMSVKCDVIVFFPIYGQFGAIR